MKKYILNPKVVRGGKAIPLGNNFYYMRGRKHEQGGIDLGADDKNGLEVLRKNYCLSYNFHA